MYDTPEVLPLKVEDFMKAANEGRRRSEAPPDPKVVWMRSRRPLARSVLSREREEWLVAMEVFNQDRNLVLSFFYRLELLMSLITKRKFRRERRAVPDGSFNVSDDFVKAVCEMPFTRKMARRPRILKRSLGLMLRKVEASAR